MLSFNPVSQDQAQVHLNSTLPQTFFQSSLSEFVPTLALVSWFTVETDMALWADVLASFTSRCCVLKFSAHYD